MAAVTGACLLVRRSHYEAVGGLNEEQLKVAFNDIDFCLKLRELGLHNIYAPAARLIHHESVSRGDDLSGEKAERFKREALWMKNRWSDQLLNDCHYNPNLSLSFMPFSHGAPMSLATPPRLQRLLPPFRQKEGS
jgi:O-antigen biosynthesis protein